MLRYSNINSGIRHIMLYPESAKDEKHIAILRRILPSIAPGKFDQIDLSDPEIYAGTQIPVSEESLCLHLYCRPILPPLAG
jgi:hypothetical protein